MPDTASESAKELLPVNRRGFLKIGAAGALKAGAAGTATLTAGAGITACTTTRVQRPPDSEFKYLREKDIVILKALTPAVIPAEFTGTEAENQAKLERFMPQVDTFLVHSSNFTQVAMEDLFDQLYFAPTKILLTGLWTRWENATPEQINAFLIDWRDSSFNLLRGGYSQLTQLVTVIWYSQPENWPATHYPGPPKHITG